LTFFIGGEVPPTVDNGRCVEPAKAQGERRAQSGFDMDIVVVLFLVALAIWMFAIWRDYNERHTHDKS